MTSLTGLSPNNPLRYLGPHVSIATVVTRNRAPTGADYRQPETGKLYPFNTYWLVAKDPTTGTEGDLWYLSKIVSNVAFWMQLSTGSSGPLVNIPVPNGTSPVMPSGSGAISFTSTAGTITITGGLNTINFDLEGGSVGIDTVQVQAVTAPGVNPVAPTLAGLITFNGNAVANHSVPVESRSRALNTYNLEVQYATSAAATDATKSGLAHFNSTEFSVDANGFVALIGGSQAIDQIGVDTFTGPGTNPVLPAANGQITVTGGQVGTGVVGTNVIRTDSLAANTYTIQIQRSTAVASTTLADNGVSHFDSSAFTVDANGFVQLVGGSTPPIQKVVVDAHTAPGTSPVVSDGSGQITVTGAQVAAGTVGTNVIRTDSLAANTYTIEIQRSTSNATTDVTKNGVSHFKSTDFSVDSNAFVSLATTGAGKTITGDSGGALSPTANNWNILGLSGSKTSGSGSTLTIKSPPFSQVGSSATSSLNTGEFVTAAVTRTLPASAGLADGDLFMYVCTTSGALVIQSVSAQKIRLGNQITGTAGSITSTAIGDSITLRFNATDGFFYAVAGWGNWTVSP